MSKVTYFSIDCDYFPIDDEWTTVKILGETEHQAAWRKSRASLDELSTPVGKKECPCEGCPQADRCATQGLQCSAFLNWSENGDYEPHTVALRIKPIQQRNRT